MLTGQEQVQTAKLWLTPPPAPAHVFVDSDGLHWDMISFNILFFSFFFHTAIDEPTSVILNKT